MRSSVTTDNPRMTWASGSGRRPCPLREQGQRYEFSNPPPTSSRTPQGPTCRCGEQICNGSATWVTTDEGECSISRWLKSRSHREQKQALSSEDDPLHPAQGYSELHENRHVVDVEASPHWLSLENKELLPKLQRRSI